LREIHRQEAVIAEEEEKQRRIKEDATNPEVNALATKIQDVQEQLVSVVHRKEAAAAEEQEKKR
jgi:hypothetical protein